MAPPRPRLIKEVRQERVNHFCMFFFARIVLFLFVLNFFKWILIYFCAISGVAVERPLGGAAGRSWSATSTVRRRSVIEWASCRALRFIPASIPSIHPSLPICNFLKFVSLHLNSIIGHGANVTHQNVQVRQSAVGIPHPGRNRLCCSPHSSKGFD